MAARLTRPEHRNPAIGRDAQHGLTLAIAPFDIAARHARSGDQEYFLGRIFVVDDAGNPRIAVAAKKLDAPVAFTRLEQEHAVICRHDEPVDRRLRRGALRRRLPLADKG
jgi:hypothetical protein